MWDGGERRRGDEDVVEGGVGGEQVGRGCGECPAGLGGEEGLEVEG